MAATALRPPIAVRDVPATITAAAFAVGTAVATVAWWDAGAIPHGKRIALLIVVAALARLVLWRRPLPQTQQTVVIMSGVVAAALLAAPYMETRAPALAGPAVALAAGVFFRRRPTVAIVIAFAIASTYNSLDALLGVDPYRPHDLVLAGLCVAVLLGYVSGDRDRRPVPLVGAILFALYVAVTRVYAEAAGDPVIGEHAFKVLGWYMLVLLAVAYGPWNPDTHRRIAKGVLVVIILVSGYAVLRWIIGPAQAERELVLSSGTARYNFSDGKLNVFGTFPNTRSLGVWTTTALPMALALAFYLRGRWRWMAAVAVGLTFTALLGSELRSGVPAATVGCFIVVIVMAFTRAGGRLHLGALLGAGGALAATVVLVIGISAGPSYSDHSYSSIVNPVNDSSFKERIYKWEALWRDADKHPLGKGLGTAGRTAVAEARFFTPSYYDVDNSYLKIALDQGIFGLVLFLAAILGLLAALVRRSLLTSDPQRAALGAAGAGALSAFMVVMGTGNYIEGLPAFSAWLFAGLGLAQFATVSSYRRASRSDAGLTS